MLVGGVGGHGVWLLRGGDVNVGIFEKPRGGVDLRFGGDGGPSGEVADAKVLEVVDGDGAFGDG